MTALPAGKLISVAGIDGAGKSTLAPRITALGIPEPEPGPGDEGDDDSEQAS